MNIKIHPIPALRDNYIWALINPDNHVLIVDPGEAGPVMAFLNQHQYQLSGILITHHHWDHTNGIDEIKSVYKDIPVYAGFNEPVANATVKLREDVELSHSHFPRFKVLAIPGHTLGHTAYYADDILFTGDTLFAAGCGRIFEGTPTQMLQSLQKIAALPDATKIYCGHEYTLNNLKFASLVEPNNAAIHKRLIETEQLRKKNQPSLPSTVAIEKQTNPFLRCDQPEVITSVSRYAGRSLQGTLEVFTALRKWKDRF